jgi:putative spermidine/putrescine transport system substrate-binding protein
MAELKGPCPNSGQVVRAFPQSSASATIREGQDAACEQDVLWDPAYKGRVGLTALNGQLGIAFLAKINRLRGSNEENFEPAFKALREMLPNVGAIGANLGYATLAAGAIAAAIFQFRADRRARASRSRFRSRRPAPSGWHTSMS